MIVASLIVNVLCCLVRARPELTLCGSPPLRLEPALRVLCASNCKKYFQKARFACCSRGATLLEQSKHKIDLWERQANRQEHTSLSLCIYIYIYVTYENPYQQTCWGTKQYVLHEKLRNRGAVDGKLAARMLCWPAEPCRPLFFDRQANRQQHTSSLTYEDPYQQSCWGMIPYWSLEKVW